MIAFIVATIVGLCTLALCALMVMAEMSKPIPGSGSDIIGTFCVGMALAALITLSHFLPHWSW